MSVDFVKLSTFQLNRIQRLMLYGGATLWFLAVVISARRNYQDTWILEDIFWPYIGLLFVFFFVFAREEDNRFVAILCAVTVMTVALVPAFKYLHPYGTTIDAVDHYLMIESLTRTGRPSSLQTYASIPAAHSWLSSLALMANLSAAEVTKYGLPLMRALNPLLIYWICRRVAVPAHITKYTLGISCLTAFPVFTPNGTSLAMLPLLLILATLVLRGYYSDSRSTKLIYTLVFLLGIIQLVFWHSTTPLLLPLLLVSLSLTPAIVRLVRDQKIAVTVDTSFLRVALLAGVLYAGYHVIEADHVYRVVVSELQRITAIEEVQSDLSRVVPQRLFEIQRLDMLRIAVLMHGRDLFMLGFMLVGMLVVWLYRREWQHLLPFYAALFLTMMPFALFILLGGGGAGFQRWIIVPLLLSPFFAGPALWWIHRRALVWLVRHPFWSRIAWRSLIVLVLGIWMVQYYNYQPLVPKAKSLTPGTLDEYIVWMHHVNTGYQERMLRFAEGRSPTQVRFASDITGGRQYARFFGLRSAYQRRLVFPLRRQRPIEQSRAGLFMLHWPGPAGAFNEKVEMRSIAHLTELRDTEGWSLIYDNGESFILHIPDHEQ
jgi:hypothetical protein